MNLFRSIGQVSHLYISFDYFAASGSPCLIWLDEDRDYVTRGFQLLHNQLMNSYISKTTSLNRNEKKSQFKGVLASLGEASTNPSKGYKTVYLTSAALLHYIPVVLFLNSTAKTLFFYRYFASYSSICSTGLLTRILDRLI